MRAAILVFVVGCGGGSSSNQGELGEACYPNGTCNVTLTCAGGVCVALDAGVLVDAAPVDAPVFTCANDSTLEPNDTVANAYVTPVDTNPTVNFMGLAICPTATDKDHYRVNLSGVNGIEVIASWTSGSPVQVSLLNAGGTSIANGIAGATSTRACAANLPTGAYYAAVFASSINNYSLSIKTVTTCN